MLHITVLSRVGSTDKTEERIATLASALFQTPAKSFCACMGGPLTTFRTATKCSLLSTRGYPSSFATMPSSKRAQRRPSPVMKTSRLNEYAQTARLTQPIFSNTDGISTPLIGSASPQQKRKRRLHRYFTLQYHIRLIVRQGPKLLSLLLRGTPRWLFKLIRLLAFVFALLPGFLVFAYYYFWSADRISVPYKDAHDGRTSRHFLDVYGSRTTPRHQQSSTSVAVTDDPRATSRRRSIDSFGDNGEPSGAARGRDSSKPVVVFLTGGAWIIGYKMWGAFLARVLVPHGILVIIPDYRNFPQVTVGDMVLDVDASIQWTLDNCRAYGGDPSKVVIVGQSAGAHLGSCVLLRKAIDELKQLAGRNHAPLSGSSSVSSLESTIETPPLRTKYKARDIMGFMAASGPYNVVAMQDIFHKHGLDRNIVSAMFGNNLDRHSPTHLVEDCRSLQADTRTCTSSLGGEDTDNGLLLSQLLPPFCIVHGTADKTVPYSGAIEYAACLSNAGIRVSSKCYEDWSHTDPIIESPMTGDHIFHSDVYDFVRQCTADEGDEGMVSFDESLPACKPICFSPLVSLGRFFNPF